MNGTHLCVVHCMYTFCAYTFIMFNKKFVFRLILCFNCAIFRLYYDGFEPGLCNGFSVGWWRERNIHTYKRFFCSAIFWIPILKTNTHTRKKKNYFPRNVWLKTCIISYSFRFLNVKDKHKQIPRLYIYIYMYMLWMVYIVYKKQEKVFHVSYKIVVEKL